MDLNEYQRQAMQTCMDSCDNFSYMMLNLVGEVGEFASKVAKGIRKEELTIGGTDISDSDLIPNASFVGWTHASDELMKEAGDILWQLAGLCYVMGWDLEDVAKQNIDKLASRRKRGVIDGDGDNR